MTQIIFITTCSEWQTDIINIGVGKKNESLT